MDPKHKGRQNATMFCGFCRTNGHTPSCCRKKIRDNEFKKLQNEATANKKHTLTQDYKKRREPSQGTGKWTSRECDIGTRRSIAYAKKLSHNGAMMSTPKPDTRRKFRPSNQSYNNFS